MGLKSKSNHLVLSEGDPPTKNMKALYQSNGSCRHQDRHVYDNGDLDPVSVSKSDRGVNLAIGE